MGRAQRHPSSFAKCACLGIEISRPIFGICTKPDPAAKRGIGPGLHSRRVPVFHRIKVNLVEISAEIVLVTQRMLPIPPRVRRRF
jgi:hypothetical protein